MFYSLPAEGPAECLNRSFKPWTQNTHCPSISTALMWWEGTLTGGHTTPTTVKGFLNNEYYCILNKCTCDKRITDICDKCDILKTSDKYMTIF